MTNHRGSLELVLMSSAHAPRRDNQRSVWRRDVTLDRFTMGARFRSGGKNVVAALGAVALAACSAGPAAPSGAVASGGTTASTAGPARSTGGGGGGPGGGGGFTGAA